MLLNTAYKKYYDLLKKGVEDGLDHNDYKQVLSLSKQHYENDVNKKYWVALMQDINYLLDDLNLDPNITYDISPECMNYILEHCYLLPLVIANGRGGFAKPFQEGTYLFSCQFHYEEDYPCMEVIDYENKFKCYDCGLSGDIIYYLRRYENIKRFDNIINLIRRIYRLDEVMLSQRLFDLSKKYRSALTSDQYKRLLDKGYALFKANNLLSINGESVDKIFEDRFYLIHRIESGEYDPYFKYEKNNSYKLKLVKGEYEPIIDNLEKRL